MMAQMFGCMDTPLSDERMVTSLENADFSSSPAVALSFFTATRELGLSGAFMTNTFAVPPTPMTFVEESPNASYRYSSNREPSSYWTVTVPAPTPSDPRVPINRFRRLLRERLEMHRGSATRVMTPAAAPTISGAVIWNASVQSRPGRHVSQSNVGSQLPRHTHEPSPSSPSAHLPPLAHGQASHAMP
jgi:hypothetical protein